MATKLTVVPPDTKPAAAAKVKPATIRAAAELGERDLLIAMRTKAASEIDAGVPPAYLAPLMRQLRELDKEIRLLDIRLAEEAAASDSGPVQDEAFDASAI